MPTAQERIAGANRLADLLSKATDFGELTPVRREILIQAADRITASLAGYESDGKYGWLVRFKPNPDGDDVFREIEATDAAMNRRAECRLIRRRRAETREIAGTGGAAWRLHRGIAEREPGGILRAFLVHGYDRLFQVRRWQGQNIRSIDDVIPAHIGGRDTADDREYWGTSAGARSQPV